MPPLAMADIAHEVTWIPLLLVASIKIKPFSTAIPPPAAQLELPHHIDI
jgi:hypothetical protein